MSKGLKAFGKVSDGLKVNFDRRPTNEYIKFLNNYNTANTDNTYSNLSDWASRASNNLDDMGGYNFKVNASEQARQKAENETFQNYLSKVLPAFEDQADNLQTRLLNQGIGVDSSAYRKALEGLAASQNATLSDGAYQAIEAGQNAYQADLNNQINAANFANNAQQDYINQLISALSGSASAYDVATDKYNAGNNLAINKANAQNNSLNQKLKALGMGINTAKSAISGLTGL